MGNYGDEARANEAKRAAAARKWGTMLPAAGTLVGGVGGAVAGGIAGSLLPGGGTLSGAVMGGGLGATLGGGAGQLGGMALTSYADDIDAKREEEKLKRIQNQERAFSMLAPYLQR